MGSLRFEFFLAKTPARFVVPKLDVKFDDGHM